MPVTTRARSRQQRDSLPIPSPQQNATSSKKSNSAARERHLTFPDDDETDTECRFSSTDNSRNSSYFRDGDDMLSAHHRYKRTTVTTHTPSQESIHAVYRGHVSALKEHHAIQELTKLLDKRSTTPKTDYTYARLPAYTGSYAINNRDQEVQPNLCRRPISPADYDQTDDAFDVSSAHSSNSKNRRDEFSVLTNETMRRNGPRVQMRENGNISREDDSVSMVRSAPPPSTASVGQKFMRYFIIRNKDVQHHHHYHDGTPDSDRNTVQEPSTIQNMGADASPFSDDEGFADENGGAGSVRVSPAAESRSGVARNLRSHSKVRSEAESVEPTTFDERNLYAGRSHRIHNGGITHDVVNPRRMRSYAFTAVSSAFMRFRTLLTLPIQILVWLLCAGASNLDRLARRSSSGFSRAGIRQSSNGVVPGTDRHTFVATERETTTETEVETIIHHHLPPQKHRGLAVCGKWLALLMAIPLLLLLAPVCYRMCSENMHSVSTNDLLVKPFSHAIDAARFASSYVSNQTQRVFSDTQREGKVAQPQFEPDRYETKDALGILPSVTVKLSSDFPRIPAYVGSKSYTIIHNHITPPNVAQPADTHVDEIEKEKQRLLIFKAALTESKQLIAAEREVLLEKFQTALEKLESKLTARLDSSEIIFAEYTNNERKRADEHENRAANTQKRQSVLDDERFLRLSAQMLHLNASINDLHAQLKGRPSDTEHQQSSMRTFISELFMLERLKANPCCLRLESELETLRATLNLMQSTLADLKKPSVQNVTVPHDDRKFTREFVENASTTTFDYANQIATNVSAKLDQFEAQLQSIQTLFEQRLQKTLEVIREETTATLLLHEQWKERVTVVQNDVGTVDAELLKRYVDEALVRYDSDKTGEPDFALESSGGEVLSIRCTTPWHSTTVVYKVAGIPVWWRRHGDARAAIQRDMSPGNCFAFQGFPGTLVVKLAAYVRPTAVSIEHIHRSNAPSGKIDSAPKDFEVYGLRGIADIDEPQLLVRGGRFDADGPSLQTFPVTESLKNARNDVFNIVELRVLSNHGSPSHTCVYRLRVHGVMQPRPT